MKPIGMQSIRACFCMGILASGVCALSACTKRGEQTDRGWTAVAAVKTSTQPDEVWVKGHSVHSLQCLVAPHSLTLL